MQESPVLKEEQKEKLKPQKKHEKLNIDEKIAQYKKGEVKKVGLSILLKPAIFSVFALLFSFVIDLSSVPVLGDITTKIAQSLFPEWTPINKDIEPLTFWWLPLWTFAVFVLMSVRAFNRLRNEVISSNSRENIDRILSASASVVDAIATALPLVGAAILLVSIKLGPEIFLGFSVPFEIKALLVLAIGKLFEPIFDTMGVRFQKIIDKAIDMKESYFANSQLELTQKLVDKFEQFSMGSPTREMESSKEELENYKLLLKDINEISKLTYRNFGATYQVLDRITKLMDANNSMFDHFDEMSKHVGEMAEKMNNDNVSDSLKSLKTIVSKVG